jgi:hypothetical protein
MDRYLAGLGQTQKMLESISGPNIVQQDLNHTQRLLDLVSGRSVFQQDLNHTQRLLDLVSGPNAFQRTLDTNERLSNLLQSVGGVDTIRIGSMLDSIAGNRGFAQLIGTDSLVSGMLGRPSFRSLIGNATLPRAGWSSVLADFTPLVGAGLVGDFGEAIDAISDTEPEQGAGTWWVGRLSTAQQLGLLVAALAVLDKASRFATDLSGERELPPAYYSGTQLLFALVAVLLIYIQAKADEDNE